MAQDTNFFDQFDEPTETGSSAEPRATVTPPTPSTFADDLDKSGAISRMKSDVLPEMERQQGIEQARAFLESRKKQLQVEQEAQFGPQTPAIPEDKDATGGEMFREIGRGFSGTIPQALGATMRQFGDTIGDRAGDPNDPRNALARGLYDKGQSLSDLGEANMRSIPARRVPEMTKIRTDSVKAFGKDIADWLQSQVGQAISTGVPMIAGGVVLGPMGLAGMALPLGWGEVRESLEKEGINDPKLINAYTWAAGTAVGMLDTIVPNSILTAEVKKGLSKYMLMRIAKTAGKIGLEEAITEGIQESIQIAATAEARGMAIGANRHAENIVEIGRELYEKRWQIAEATAGGFVGGVALGTPSALAAGKEEKTKPGENPSATNVEFGEPVSTAPAGQQEARSGYTASGQKTMTDGSAPAMSPLIVRGADDEDMVRRISDALRNSNPELLTEFEGKITREGGMPANPDAVTAAEETFDPAAAQTDAAVRRRFQLETEIEADRQTVAELRGSKDPVERAKAIEANKRMRENQAALLAMEEADLQASREQGLAEAQRLVAEEQAPKDVAIDTPAAEIEAAAGTLAEALREVPGAEAVMDEISAVAEASAPIEKSPSRGRPRADQQVEQVESETAGGAGQAAQAVPSRALTADEARLVNTAAKRITSDPVYAEALSALPPEQAQVVNDFLTRVAAADQIVPAQAQETSAGKAAKTKITPVEYAGLRSRAFGLVNSRTRIDTPEAIAAALETDLETANKLISELKRLKWLETRGGALRRVPIGRRKQPEIRQPDLPKPVAEKGKKGQTASRPAPPPASMLAAPIDTVIEKRQAAVRDAVAADWIGRLGNNIDRILDQARAALFDPSLKAEAAQTQSADYANQGAARVEPMIEALTADKRVTRDRAERIYRALTNENRKFKNREDAIEAIRSHYRDMAYKAAASVVANKRRPASLAGLTSHDTAPFAALVDGERVINPAGEALSSEERLARAKAAGYDTSKTWGHISSATMRPVGEGVTRVQVFSTAEAMTAGGSRAVRGHMKFANPSIINVREVFAENAPALLSPSDAFGRETAVSPAIAPALDPVIQEQLGFGHDAVILDFGAGSDRVVIVPEGKQVGYIDAEVDPVRQVRAESMASLEFSPEVDGMRDFLGEELSKLIGRLQGLGFEVNARNEALILDDNGNTHFVTDVMSGMQAVEAAVDPIKRLIKLTMQYGPERALRMLRHEEIHALRLAGVISPQQWQTLKAATEMPVPKARADKLIKRLLDEGKLTSEQARDLSSRSATYREIFAIDTRYVLDPATASQAIASLVEEGHISRDEALNMFQRAGALTMREIEAIQAGIKDRDVLNAMVEDYLAEEAVAHMASEYAGGERYETVINKIFAAIQDFIERLHKMLRGAGFETADSILRDINQGKYTALYQHLNATEKVDLGPEVSELADPGISIPDLSPEHLELWGQGNAARAIPSLAGEVDVSDPNLMRDPRGERYTIRSADVERMQYVKWLARGEHRELAKEASKNFGVRLTEMEVEVAARALEKKYKDNIARLDAVITRLEEQEAPKVRRQRPDQIDAGTHLVRAQRGRGTAVYKIYGKAENGAPGKMAGFVRISQNDDGRWEVDKVEVNEGSRRQGIATKLYEAVEKDLGIQMWPSGTLLPGGYAFWQNRNPDAVKYHQLLDGVWTSPKELRREFDDLERKIDYAERDPQSYEGNRAEFLAWANQKSRNINRLLMALPIEATEEGRWSQMFSLTSAPRRTLSIPGLKERVEAQRAEQQAVVDKVKSLGSPFAERPALTSWLDLAPGGFALNVNHIADKRARKDDKSKHGDLSTPEAVRAHVQDVLDNATYGFEYHHEDGITLVKPDRMGDKVVGLKGKRDIHGRYEIKTAFIAEPGTMPARMRASIERNGASALKWKKDHRTASELLTTMRQGLGQYRDPSVSEAIRLVQASQVRTRTFSGGEQFSLADYNPLQGFYSPVLRALELRVQRKQATPDAWAAELAPGKHPNITKDQLDAIGFKPWLDEQKKAGKKSLTKDEVVEFVRQNDVQVIERMLRDDLTKEMSELNKLVDAKRIEVSRLFNSLLDSGVPLDNAHETPEYQQAIAELNALEDDYNFAASSTPRYSYATAAGGTNYRELLLALPNNPFVERHWDAQGVFADAQLKDRVGPNGENILSIEAVQSAQHQAGEIDGYVDTKVSKEITRLRGKIAPLKTELGDLISIHGATITPEMQNLNDQINALERDLEKALIIKGRSNVPDAPFKDDRWIGLTLKRLLQYAAQNGYDAVTWLRGEQAAKAAGDAPKKLYDEKIPAFINRYTKPWNGKIEQVELVPAIPEDNGLAFRSDAIIVGMRTAFDAAQLEERELGGRKHDKFVENILNPIFDANSDLESALAQFEEQDGLFADERDNAARHEWEIAQGGEQWADEVVARMPRQARKYVKKYVNEALEEFAKSQADRQKMTYDGTQSLLRITPEMRTALAGEHSLFTRSAATQEAFDAPQIAGATSRRGIHTPARNLRGLSAQQIGAYIRQDFGFREVRNIGDAEQASRVYRILDKMSLALDLPRTTLSGAGQVTLDLGYADGQGNAAAYTPHNYTVGISRGNERTLTHEIFHAVFDHGLAKYAKVGERNFNMAFLSGGQEFSRPPTIDEVRTPVLEAWKGVEQAIWGSSYELMADISDYQWDLRRLDRHIAEGGNREKFAKHRDDLIEKIDGLMKEQAIRATNYSVRSKKVDTDQIAIGKPRYLTMPGEMMARAFETYLQDKVAKDPLLSEAGQANAAAGMVYPENRLERARIAKAFDNLIATLKVQPVERNHRFAGHMIYSLAGQRKTLAAIKIDDKIYTGFSHYEAMEKASNDLNSNGDIEGLADKAIDGFITTVDGKFYTRKEASDLLKQQFVDAQTQIIDDLADAAKKKKRWSFNIFSLAGRAPSNAIKNATAFPIEGLAGYVQSLGSNLVGRDQRIYYAYPEGTQILPFESLKKKRAISIAQLHATEHTDGRWEIMKVEVKPEHQGKKVATRLYNAVEAHIGSEFTPSGWLTNDGYAFWKARDPDKVKWHQQWVDDQGAFMISPKALWEMKIGNERQIEILGNDPELVLNAAEEIEKLEVESRKLDEMLKGLPAASKTPEAFAQMFSLDGRRSEINLSQIIADTIKALKMTTTQGRYGLRLRDPSNGRTIKIPMFPGLRAQYDRRLKAARVQNVTDISSIAHEGGHHLEGVLAGQDFDQLRATHRNEIEAMAASGDVDVISEGFARFFEAFILDPKRAETLAPNFTQAFAAHLDAFDSQLLENLEAIRDAHSEYKSLDVVQQGANDVATWAEPSKMRKIAAFLKAPDRLHQMGDWFARGGYYFVGSTNPVRNVFEVIMRRADENGVRDDNGRRISARYSENPDKLIRMMKGAARAGHAALMRGVPRYGGFEPAGPALRDAMITALGSKKADFAKEKTDIFDSYMISRRAVHKWREWNHKLQVLADLGDSFVKVGQLVTVQREKGRLVQDKITRRERYVRDTDVRLQEVERELAKLRTVEMRQLLILNDQATSETIKRNARQRLRESRVKIRNGINRQGDLYKLRSDTEKDLADLRDQLDIQNETIKRSVAVHEDVRAEMKRVREGGLQAPPTRIDKDLSWHEKNIAELEKIHDGRHGRGDFKRGADMVHEYANSLLTYELHAGRISQELYDELMKEPFYVPFQRDMELFDQPNAGGPGDKKGPRFQKLQRMKGSQRDIVSPLEALTHRTYHTFAADMHNKTTLAMLEMAERVGATDIIERIEKKETLDKDHPSTFDRLVKEAMSMGMEKADAVMLIQRFDQNLSDQHVELIYSPEGTVPKYPLIMSVWENGKRNRVRLNDTKLGRELYEAMNAIGREQANLFIKWVGVPSRVLSAGVTTEPAYFIPNIARDIVVTTILTGNLPGITHARGLYYEISNNPTVANALRRIGIEPSNVAELYARAGGLRGGQFTAQLEAVRDDYKIKDLRKRGYRVFTGWSTLAAVAELSETMNRLGTFGASLATLKKLNPGMSDFDAVGEAAMIARDLTDFDRAGSRASTAIKLVPFLNPAIQSLDKVRRRLTFAESDRGRVAWEDMRLFLQAAGFTGLTRMAAEEASFGVFGRSQKIGDSQDIPVSTRQAISDGMRTWLRLGVYATVLMALKMLYHDDDEYRDVKDSTLWTHSPIKAFGTWFRIPKAFEYALPGNIAEIVADWAMERDPRLWSRMGDAVRDALVPPWMPQAMTLFMGVELGLRYDAKHGEARPLTREDLSRAPAYLQFDAYSSYLAIKLAEMADKAGISISPATIDFVLSNGGGYWGKDIQKFSNMFDPKRPPSQWTDVPVVGTVIDRVTIDPARQSSSVEMFWKLMGRGRGEYDTALAGYQRIIKITGGDPNAVKEYLARLPESQKIYAVLEQNFSAEEKAKHPLHRTGNVLIINNDVRRQFIASGRVEDTSTKERRFIELPPAKSKEVQDILGRLNAVTAWNGLQVAKVPGWETRNIRHEQSILDELKASSETVYDEVMRRRRKAKIGDAEADLSRWQAVEQRVKERIGDEEWLARQNSRRRR